EKKNLLLASLGVDIVISVPFSEIRNMQAIDFVKSVFVDLLNAKSIVCGYDFRFGNNREGDVSFIKSLLSDSGVTFITPNAVVLDGVPISSTLIRGHIANGDFEKANALLGYSFSFVGEVIRGRQLGRELGFPTINQKYPEQLAKPRYGVYAVKCSVDGKIYGGVANVGVKPTVGAEDTPLCETYLFDYSGDCYSKAVETEFVAFIREEKRFSSLDELKERVLQDISVAKNLLKEF
ncbi:MAG: riboflavin biosynthesis protein RibF, partial [Clostridia bacterium]|nr:riboflavin biosynthesis protein RibF [Clostridia bacterium]